MSVKGLKTLGLGCRNQCQLGLTLSGTPTFGRLKPVFCSIATHAPASDGLLGGRELGHVEFLGFYVATSQRLCSSRRGPGDPARHAADIAHVCMVARPTGIRRRVPGRAARRRRKETAPPTTGSKPRQADGGDLSLQPPVANPGRTTTGMAFFDLPPESSSKVFNVNADRGRQEKSSLLPRTMPCGASSFPSPACPGLARSTCSTDRPSIDSGATPATGHGRRPRRRRVKVPSRHVVGSRRDVRYRVRRQTRLFRTYDAAPVRVGGPGGIS